jgi:hypothetical protein
MLEQPLVAAAPTAAVEIQRHGRAALGDIRRRVDIERLTGIAAVDVRYVTLDPDIELEQVVKGDAVFDVEFGC